MRKKHASIWKRDTAPLRCFAVKEGKKLGEILREKHHLGGGMGTIFRQGEGSKRRTKLPKKKDKLRDRGGKERKQH